MAINVKRCAILHENEVLKASTLLKLWEYKIPQHIMAPLSCDGTSLDSFAVISSKNTSNDKDSRKTTTYCNFVRMQGLFLDSVRVFRCPNSTVVGVNVPIDAKMGIVTPQKVPWPSDINHHSSEELVKVVRTSESPSCNRCTSLVL
ncbi:hypothetical protein AVEN_56290-1 [Araneus ventricosus]|uniref:Uncharacterized protein n=1 Tax=Araneus ventricosus TaxID=182803 RepID=A0A4Y2IUY7_ARAVE|nr:hypothetical protein AVEN_56290-1 [Araneus ventricosus]